MSEFASLYHFAEVNPLTPAFNELDEEAQIPFMPLENIWAYGKADYSSHRNWKRKDTSYTQFHKGDVLVPKVTPTVFHGRSMIAEIDGELGLATSEVHVLRTKQGVEPRWVLYNVLSGKFLDEARGAVTGVGGLQRISSQYLSSYKVRVVPLATQRRIADRLDRETGEIDSLVKELDEYVGLLEKRKISAVEDELARLSASEGPLMPLKFAISKRFSGDWGSDFKGDESDLPCVRVADFDRSKSLVSEDVPTIRSYPQAVREAKHLKSGDVLVEKSGGGAKTPVGSAILYVGSEDALCANFIEVVRFNSDQCARYWVYVLKKEFSSRSTMRYVKQTTGIQNLDSQGFFDQKLPCPPLETQRRIVERLDRETAETDALIKECTALKELLLKRRQVLITDMVTGKVEV